MKYLCPIEFTRIDAATAWERLRSSERAVLFDVRDVADYRRQHIPGAAHLSMERMMAWMKRLAKDVPILIYCYHGNASQTYAQAFVDFRFSEVYSIDGGYAALQALACEQA